MDINEGKEVIKLYPYGVTANRWDVRIPFAPLWEQYRRVCKERTAIVLHAQEPFTSDLIQSNRKIFRYKWVWAKHQCTGFLNAKKQPLRNCEDIVVFYRGQCTYHPQMRRGKLQLKSTGGPSTNYHSYRSIARLSDEHYPTMLLDFPLRRVKNGHPTQKPVALLEYLIRTYTDEGDTVPDNCMGHGSTGVACGTYGPGLCRYGAGP